MIFFLLLAAMGFFFFVFLVGNVGMSDDFILFNFLMLRH
jgi:hypothetical protein